MPRPLTMTMQNQIERRSLRAIEDAVDPWICTWFDTRDDFGQDGIVQVVDEEKGRNGTGAVSPTMFNVQAKATDGPFGRAYMKSLEVRHLKLWAKRSDCG